MLKSDKTVHDSVESALKTAFNDETKDDCVDAEPVDSQYHLQYVVGEEPEINLSCLNGKAEAYDLLEKVPLPKKEVSDTYVLLRSDAETPAEAQAELESVAESIAGTTAFTNPRSFRKFSLEYIGDMKERLMFWR